MNRPPIYPPAGKTLDRRQMLALTAALGFGSLAQAGGHDQGVPARDQDPDEVEAANEDLVTRFCKAWELRDVEKLVPFLADDLVYQMFEGRPDLIGVEAFRSEVGPWLSRLVRVEWDIVRSQAIGPLVINDRIDRFIAGPDGRDMVFRVAGIFVVQDRRIVLWRDYNIPGRPHPQA
ncbi:MAG: nuclear transport factor 2 family protein [Chromatiales bacterium]|nr:nuclear transport factor 2 family protein [Chromatiales bacterium]